LRYVFYWKSLFNFWNSCSFQDISIGISVVISTDIWPFQQIFLTLLNLTSALKTHVAIDRFEFYCFKSFIDKGENRGFILKGMK
jgi:hypothetical protein